MNLVPALSVIYFYAGLAGLTDEYQKFAEILSTHSFLKKIKTLK